MALIEHPEALIGIPELRIVLLDRTLAGEVCHLVLSVTKLLNEKRCVLRRIERVWNRLPSRSGGGLKCVPFVGVGELMSIMIYHKYSLPN